MILSMINGLFKTLLSMNLFWNAIYAYSIIVSVTSVLMVVDLGFYYLTSKCSWFDKYLIQKEKNNKHLSHNYQVILVNLFIMFIVFITTITYTINNNPQILIVTGYPKMWDIVWQNLTILLIDDFYMYWYHRLLHTRVLFKNIHHIHHRAYNPNLFDFIYAHPLEPFIGSFAVIGCYLFLLPHIVTICISIVIRYIHENEIHSGYDFPWSVSNIIPFLVPARDHDLHHSRGKGNYGNMFTFWDKIFQTWRNPKDVLQCRIRKQTNQEEGKKTTTPTSPSS